MTPTLFCDSLSRMVTVKVLRMYKSGKCVAPCASSDLGLSSTFIVSCLKGTGASLYNKRALPILPERDGQRAFAHCSNETLAGQPILLIPIEEQHEVFHCLSSQCITGSFMTAWEGRWSPSLMVCQTADLSSIKHSLFIAVSELCVQSSTVRYEVYLDFDHNWNFFLHITLPHPSTEQENMTTVFRILFSI